MSPSATMFNEIDYLVIVNVIANQSSRKGLAIQPQKDERYAFPHQMRRRVRLNNAPPISLAI